MSVPDEGYSRSMSCALSSISKFLLELFNTQNSDLLLCSRIGITVLIVFEELLASVGDFTVENIRFTGSAPVCW